MGHKEKEVTLGSLFAGIGGFDLGFERAGFKTLWQCEIDKAAQGVLRFYFPEAKRYDDVRAVGAHNLGPVDVLTFGSPCQDLSVAGKRAGMAGERSGLFHEAARIIKELRDAYGKPDFAIWENVPGAFSSNDGRDFAAVVQTLVDLGACDVCWRVLDSRYFGVAQRRRRVFLVADFGGERAEQVLFEPESLRGDITKGRKAWKEAAGGAGPGVAGGGEYVGALTATYSKSVGRMEMDAGLLVPMVPFSDEGRGAYVESKVLSTLRARDYKSPTHLVTAQPHAVAFAQNTRDEVRLMGGDGQIVGALAAQPGMKQTSYVAVCATGETTHALTSSAGRYASEDGTGRGVPTVAQAMAVRRLTPTECERLQGFPDGWTSEIVTADMTLKDQADGPRYKQLGNAVTVNVAEWIARRVFSVLNSSID